MTLSDLKRAGQVGGPCRGAITQPTIALTMKLHDRIVFTNSLLGLMLYYRVVLSTATPLTSGARIFIHLYFLVVKNVKREYLVLRSDNIYNIICNISGRTNHIIFHRIDSRTKNIMVFIQFSKLTQINTLTSQFVCP